MNYITNNEVARQDIVNSINALMGDLQKLSPHPEQPDNKGPLFIKDSPYLKAANDQDGMLGGMMMESMLGTAFADAVSEICGDWVENVDVDIDATSAMECYSEYITDVEGSATKKSAHGQGTLARLAQNPISNSFNMRCSMSDKMQEFMDDLPQRMKIEHNLEYFAKQLELLDAAAPTHSYSDYGYEERIAA